MCAENPPVPKMDEKILDIYKGYLQFPFQIFFYEYVD